MNFLAPTGRWPQKWGSLGELEPGRAIEENVSCFHLRHIPEWREKLMFNGSGRERTDRSLVSDIRDGDKQAEALLFQRHRRKVVLWVTGRTGDPYVEDHYHDGFMKILLPAIHNHKIRDEDRVEAFLRTITLRLSLRSRKTKEVMMPDGLQWENFLSAPTEALKEEADVLKSGKEEARLLREVLVNDCSQVEQALHHSYWVEGKELKAMAKEEGIREVALRKRHSRMLIRIRQGLADRLWSTLMARVALGEPTPTGALRQLQALDVLGSRETELITIRYVGKRSWEAVAKRLQCSEREAAEEMLQLLRRLLKDVG